MVRIKRSEKGLFSYLDLPKIAGGKQIAGTFAMALDFMKFQGEVAYQIAKKQALASASTVSSIGFGWSVFFFGLVQESWLTSSLGLMLVFVGTYFLAYWTPRMLGRLRESLDESGAEKLYGKWLSEHSRADDLEASGTGS